jgi:CRISPR-associated protein Cas6/Cse3/CasE subtype I-E
MAFLIDIPITEDLFFHKKLENPYNYHKLIWELWGDREPTTFLFRVDEKRILVLSSCPIDNTNTGWLGKCRIGQDHVVNYDGKYFYDIFVNPIKKSKEDHKSIPLKSESDILGWWSRVSMKYGFEINKDLTRISCGHNEISYGPSGNVITKYKVRIEGCMKIVDPVKFNNQFPKGFGPSKRFGCGLMLIVKKFD